MEKNDPAIFDLFHYYPKLRIVIVNNSHKMATGVALPEFLLEREL